MSIVNKKLKCFIYALFLIAFIALVVLQLHNISLYPAKKGFDATGHLQYVEIVKNQHRIPLANEGWETYHTPLYYIFASFLPTIKSVQFFNFFIWAGVCILIYFFIYKVLNNTLLGLLGAFLTGSLPMFLYITPMVSNELLSGFMISAALVYYLIYFKNKKSNKEDIIFGLLIGLSLLSKATSIVFLFAIILDICIDHKWHFKEIFQALWRVLLIAFLVSGWFYIRNSIFFGNPLVANTDFPGNAIHQDPGYRNLNFFIDPSGFLKLDLFHAHHYSLWAGIYYSWFYDGHNALVPVQEYSKIGIILVLFSIPLALFSVVGFIKARTSITQKNRLLFIYPLLLFLFFIVYNFKFPFYSTVKAIYLLSAVIPWIYFVICGVKMLPHKKRYMIIFILYLIIYFLLVMKNFWIIDWWYNYK